MRDNLRLVNDDAPLPLWRDALGWFLAVLAALLMVVGVATLIVLVLA
jgi:hypothetical protein